VKKPFTYNIYFLFCLLLLTGARQLMAQNETDGIMMGKNLYCVGVMTARSGWDQYWEGGLLRRNENLGTVSTKMTGAMGSLGINKKLNILFSMPYIRTSASAGQLSGFRGMQDLTVFAKYLAYRKKSGKNTFSVFAIGGLSTPVQNYVKDYLPLSIGLGSRNMILRGMLDYERNHLFTTISSSLITRSNIELDRKAYYTTQMVYSDRVDMPNVIYNNIRAGFRNKEIVAEFVADNWVTQGGFDITRNNMPFPSNRMNMTRVGINGKYEPVKWKGISLTAAFFQTVNGRNMGRASHAQFGFFYILNVSGKTGGKKN
jgi:hypothetical protein